VLKLANVPNPYCVICKKKKVDSPDSKICGLCKSKINLGVFKNCSRCEKEFFTFDKFVTKCFKCNGSAFKQDLEMIKIEISSLLNRSF
jgi:hypothetical protein